MSEDHLVPTNYRRVGHLDIYEVPNPKSQESETYTFLSHPGSAAVLAFSEEKNCVILVRQLRVPINQTILEIPAGRLNPGEHPMTAAVREFTEETGFVLNQITYFGTIFPTPGYSDERISLFGGKAGKEVGKKLDPGEETEVVFRTLPEFYGLIYTGGIQDAKTIAAAMHAKYVFGRGSKWDI